MFASLGQWAGAKSIRLALTFDMTRETWAKSVHQVSLTNETDRL